MNQSLNLQEPSFKLWSASAAGLVRNRNRESVWQSLTGLPLMACWCFCYASCMMSCRSSVSPYRCTCTSCSAVWLISIPRVCVTEISSLRTSWWTRRRPSSNSVTLAGQCRLCACLNWLLQCPFLIFNPPVSNCIIVGSVLSCPSVLSWTSSLLSSAAPAVRSSSFEESLTCPISARGTTVPQSSSLAPPTTHPTSTSGQPAACWPSCSWASPFSPGTAAWTS